MTALGANGERYYIQLMTGERKYFEGRVARIEWDETHVEAFDEDGGLVAMVPLSNVCYIRPIIGNPRGCD